MKKQNRHFPRSGFMSECVRRVTFHWDSVKEFRWRIQFLKVFSVLFPLLYVSHEFEQTPEDGEGQGSLVCHSPWIHRLSQLSNWKTTNRPWIRLWACSIASVKQTLWDPMECSLPGTSVRGILQERILEWVAMLSSREFSWPRYRTHISCIADGFFTTEPSGKPPESD